MHAMQYEITLPADYDMRIIHHRVETKGPLLDSFAGLGLKAYCVRERGADGSPVNQYAPFYLWNEPSGMNRFLWGPGFRGIVADFGRPVVRTWTGLGFERGPAYAERPRAASRTLAPVTPGADPADVIEASLAGLKQHARTLGVHSAALAGDPGCWEVAVFTLWHGTAPDDPAADRFRVLHLCAPGASAIPVGRQW